MHGNRVLTWLALAVNLVGPPTAILLAWLLSIGNHDGDSWLTLSNVGLAMAALTVVVALVDWRAGVTTSLAAALSLNYFHTDPLHTLRITDERDLVSVILLAALGVLVSATTAYRIRRNVREITAGDAAASAERLTATVEHDRSAARLWSTAIAAPVNDLSLVVARVAPAAPRGLPTIAQRRGPGRDRDTRLILPECGAALRLTQAPDHHRWLVLTPRPGIGALNLDRRAVLLFAETLELALLGREPARDPADVAGGNGPPNQLSGDNASLVVRYNHQWWFLHNAGSGVALDPQLDPAAWDALEQIAVDVPRKLPAKMLPHQSERLGMEARPAGAPRGADLTGSWTGEDGNRHEFRARAD